MNKITAVEEDKYTMEHFGGLVDDSDIQARYPSDSVSILQEYGILPHSRTYYCLLFSLYHMFIVFVISY